MPIVIVDLFSAIYVLRENEDRRGAGRYFNENLESFFDALKLEMGENFHEVEFHICHSSLANKKDLDRFYLSAYNEESIFAKYFTRKNVKAKLIPLTKTIDGLEVLSMGGVRAAFPDKHLTPAQVFLCSANNDLIEKTFQRSGIDCLPLYKAGELNPVQLKNFYATVKKEKRAAYLCSDIDDTVFIRPETFYSREREKLHSRKLVLNSEVVELAKKHFFTDKFLFTARNHPYFEIEEDLFDFQGSVKEKLRNRRKSVSLETITIENFSDQIRICIEAFKKGEVTEDDLLSIKNLQEYEEQIFSLIDKANKTQLNCSTSNENILAALKKLGVHFSGDYYTSLEFTGNRKIQVIEEVLLRDPQFKLRDCIFLLVDDAEYERAAAAEQVQRFQDEYGVTLMVVQVHKVGEYDDALVKAGAEVLSAACAVTKRAALGREVLAELDVAGRKVEYKTGHTAAILRSISPDPLASMPAAIPLALTKDLGGQALKRPAAVRSAPRKEEKNHKKAPVSYDSGFFDESALLGESLTRLLDQPPLQIDTPVRPSSPMPDDGQQPAHMAPW